MPCCGKLLRAFFFSVMLLSAGLAQAADISIRSPQLQASDEGYSLAADFNINFNARLEEAVNKGVILYFVVDFELSRARWYWLDEQVIRRSKTFQLSYHALTRQYRLSTGALHQSYATLEEAVRIMSRLRNWLVMEKSDVREGRVYEVALSMRLDLSQMPKPFQVSALSNKDWNLHSEAVRWSFVPGEAAPVSKPAEPVAMTVPGGIEIVSTTLPATGEAK